MVRMREAIKRKLHTQGFTLAETLLAVLILLLVGVIMTTGIPAAKNAYEKVVVASNAEVLLSTTISTLRNELGTAQDVEVTGTAITYYSAARSAYSRIYVEDGNILFQRYFNNSGEDVPRLVSEKAATEKLCVTYTNVKYENGIVTFYGSPGISVNRGQGTTNLASIDELSIRVISN